VEKAIKLNEAFYSFTKASKSLEIYYEKLSKRVQSKDYLHAILQSIGEAIIVLDQDEKITVINKSAEELFCLDSKDAVGMMFSELNFTTENDNSGTSLTVDGRKYDIILSRSTVFDSDGFVRGYVILIKDITRLKELERQHERNLRLIAMGEMAAKIVHEIRSPLCSIELFSNMLSNDLEGTSHSKMAVGISTGIKSLNNILTNMLFFAKPQKPSFKDTRISEVVEESVRMLAPLIEVRGIMLSETVTEEVIYGDSELLKQVFMNIVLNAIQSMPDGGILEIVTGGNDEFVTVAVSDEGEGIEVENIEKIFDPFFSTKDKGTGLGLAIAHKIMQCHDGFIKAYKKDEKGSTFCVYFPKNKNITTSESHELLCMKSN
jgi:signal transduction histidine kinase